MLRLDIIRYPFDFIFTDGKGNFPENAQSTERSRHRYYFDAQNEALKGVRGRFYHTPFPVHTPSQVSKAVDTHELAIIMKENKRVREERNMQIERFRQERDEKVEKIKKWWNKNKSHMPTVSHFQDSWLTVSNYKRPTMAESFFNKDNTQEWVVSGGLKISSPKRVM